MKDKPVILVVDDLLQNIELLEAHLVTQGYEIIQAESGEEALGILSGDTVDLVLLDVKMPGMSGFEVLAKLRADNKTQRIPVIMVTAYTEYEEKVKALEAGCDDFITKPFDKHELLARVRSLLRIKFLNDEVDEDHEYAESVINTVREPLIALDQDLRVVTASRSFYKFFIVKPEETVGQLIYDLGDKQWDIPKLRELLETILPQKATFDNYEVEHDFAAIGRRVMLLNARQIKRVWGKERIILLAIEDITERKRLEDLLTESEMKYRRLFETASDGIVLLEKLQGHIIHANPAAEKMFGYSEREFIGKTIQDIGVSLDMSDFPGIMKSLDRSGVLNYDDVPIRTRSGQDIYTDIYMVDRANLAQCNIRDVSERKAAKGELVRLISELDIKNRELEQIIYAASHDLKSPLVNINGYTHELQMTIDNITRVVDMEDISAEIKQKLSSLVKELPESFRFINKSVIRMEMLLNGLLEFSRSGKLELKMEEIDMNMLIKEISGYLNYKWKEAGASLQVANLPHCTGDREQISRIFSNLMENAVKYLDPERKGEIKVTGYEEGDSSVYCVEDNGISIALGHQQQLFHMFHQLDPAKAGDGLGLMIVQRIVERHGGKVWLESEAGKGCRFFVKLPGINKGTQPI
ncbi:MAG: response regulator [Thermodesulfovibrionia bacterium]|nr:response regulator [Thermodesulfovibrionia bacterium]